MLGGVRDIMDHAWFRSFDWARHAAKQTLPPYVPTIRDVLDVSNFDPMNEEDNVTPYTGAQNIFDEF
jgi:cGMP-dependent protein kinase